ncbi:hypothetical protein [Amycolatopsis pithecellobii]|uniref:Uncharacterized protein n=1 Tax=Amycolatopsis pithecellobii TaxID=664692 RepID=A0A6N7Z283_9PSEU|nr:hypothetical protein [Amycolatopsis pithecellobii]MTD55703.1 hypothetical protein [Amycolatopsis pithecellobii]
MSTRATVTADDKYWTVLLPTGDIALWDGMSMPLIKLGKSLIRSNDGWLINPDQVVALIPPSNPA